MPREIPVGNGSLLVAFDSHYRIADLYFPFVGMENHCGGRFRFGVWESGRFTWIEDVQWKRTLAYVEETLVTDVLLENEAWGLSLRCHDAVDSEANVYLRKITVRNLESKPRTLKLFFHHAFHLYGNAVGDTALFDPETRSILHYKAKRYFLVNVANAADYGVTEYACGRSGFAGAEGTWRDAEDGKLSMNAAAQGAVDSTIAVTVEVPAGGSESAYYWIAAGERYGEVSELNRELVAAGPERWIQRTGSFWHAWVSQMGHGLEPLPPEIAQLYKRSLLIIRTQCDHDGAILAANDSDIQVGHADHYSYMWPRDAALVADAMDRAGYHGLSRAFFHFAHRIIKKEGYFLHKYNPDGSLASSWHPWVRNGKLQLPIQEDETALVVWALWRHYERTRDLEFVKSVYRRLVAEAADFMVSFRDPESGLPRPTYDLWEERQGVFTFTCASIYGGLSAAAHFAELLNEEDRRERYLAAMTELRKAMVSRLFMPELGRFARGLVLTEKDELVLDATVDASLFGTFFFGAFEANDPMVEGTMRAVREKLWVQTEIGGVARYERDRYHRVSDDAERLPGNPWFICTLWLAEHAIARATTVAELQSAMDLLRWVRSKARPSLVVAEQIHPYTGQPLSVAPLTWSHAQIISVVRGYLDRLREITRDERRSTVISGAENQVDNQR